MTDQEQTGPPPPMPATDQDLPALPADSQQLNLTGPITDAGLSALAACTQLATLQIESDALRGEGVQALVDLPLFVLALMGDQVRPGALPTMPSVKMLVLGGPFALAETDERLRERFPSLEMLVVMHGPTEEGQPSFDELLPLYRAFPGIQVNGMSPTPAALEKMIKANASA